MTSKLATAMDVEIGRRIRGCRCDAGLTLEELAGAVGVAYQQLQKYENGRNRIPASRLVLIAVYLDVPPEIFLRGVEWFGDVKLLGR